MRKIALVFPGQGSQYVGMGKNLYDNFKEAADVFNQANDILGFDIKELMFNGDIGELTSTDNAQPAILLASYASFLVYQQEVDMKPIFCAGHSLGEFSALAASGVLGFKDALKLVRKRGQLMKSIENDSKGKMAAVTNTDYFIIEKVCEEISKSDHIVVVSNYNAPDQIVISGHETAVDEAVNQLSSKGSRCIPLKVSGAFHSPLMENVAQEFEKELSNINFNSFSWPVISNVTGEPYQSKDEVKNLLKEQLTKPVQWINTIQYIRDTGASIVLEVGPGNVLKNLTGKNQKYLTALTMDKPEDLKELKEEVDHERDHMPNLLGRAMGIAVATQNFNFNNDEYEKGVVEPYRKIKAMQMELEKEKKEPTLEQMQQAIEMLKSVFKTKQTPIEEQVQRFNQLFDETKTGHLFPNFEMPK